MTEDALVPLPERGRVYRARRRVRLGDVAPSQRLRLDACLRYLQDVGNDDTEDSGLDARIGTGGGLWVVRRAVVEVVRPPRWGEWLDLATWCSGTGGRWAGRRLSLTGERGGQIEIETLWVHLNADTFLPARLPDAFEELYGEAAGGRKISAKHLLAGPPADGDGSGDGSGDVERVVWPLRAVDYDVMRHVNNAAYWAAVEEIGVPDGPVRATLEYGAGIEMDAPVELLVRRDDKQTDIWFTVAGAVQATCRLDLT